MIISFPFTRRKINFLFTSKVDFIWFDSQQNTALSSILKPYSVFCMDIRQYLYLSPLSLLLAIFYLPRYGKLSLYVSFIRLLHPNGLITSIHNNHTFWELSTILLIYPFIIVQNSYQPYFHSNSRKPSVFGFVSGLQYKYSSSIRFLSFSHIASLPFVKAGAPKSCFYPVGSLKLSYVQSTYLRPVCKINSICLIADSTYSHKYFTTLLNYLASYSQTFPFDHFYVALKHERSSNHYHDATKSIQSFFDYPITFIPNNPEILSSYRTLLSAEIIVGSVSSLLLEAFSLGKKVLSCNFTGFSELSLPLPIYCTCSQTSYSSFYKQLSYLRSLSESDFSNLVSNTSSDSLPVVNSLNTYKYLEKLLSSLIHKPSSNSLPTQPPASL